MVELYSDRVYEISKESEENDLLAGLSYFNRKEKEKGNITCTIF